MRDQSLFRFIFHSISPLDASTLHLEIPHNISIFHLIIPNTVINKSDENFVMIQFSSFKNSIETFRKTLPIPDRKKNGTIVKKRPRQGDARQLINERERERKKLKTASKDASPPF